MCFSNSDRNLKYFVAFWCVSHLGMWLLEQVLLISRVRKLETWCMGIKSVCFIRLIKLHPFCHHSYFGKMDLFFFREGKEILISLGWADLTWIWKTLLRFFWQQIFASASDVSETAFNKINVNTFLLNNRNWI